MPLRTPPEPLTALPPRPLPNDELLLLVNRISQGFTPESHADAIALGYDATLEQQLAPETIDDSVCDAILALFPSLGKSAKQLYDDYVTPSLISTVTTELRTAAVMRAYASKRQLLERMVEFWTDHFNIDQNDGAGRWLKTVDDRQVIRAHALGTFPDLLFASARSPAMLFYLDNYTNKKTAPQENYARELMELHTLSVTGGYTETDVKEVARCLTGWSFVTTTTDPLYGTFKFNAGNHDQGAKTVLGVTIPANGGEGDGDQVLSLLAYHPKTATFVATKLAKWLLAYDPPARVINQAQRMYLQTGGDIKAMIRVILSHDSVALAQPWVTPKLQRPFRFAMALLRSAKIQVTQPAKILSQLDLLGQTPFTWSPPNGFPDTLSAWGNSVLPRWTFASNLFDNKITGYSFDAATALEGLLTVPKSQVAAVISAVLTGSALSPADVAALQGYVDSKPLLNQANVREFFALAASAPSFQYF